MDKLKEAIELIGRDIGNIEGQQASLLSQSKAYQLFPTYATLQSQMANNIQNKHLELGLDALIDTKLFNGGDRFLTSSKATENFATKEELTSLISRIEALENKSK